MARSEHRKAAAARAAGQAGDTETLRAALTEERRGYLTRGLASRAKAVDEQLKALGRSAPADKPAPPRGSAKTRLTAEQDGPAE